MDVTAEDLLPLLGCAGSALEEVARLCCPPSSAAPRPPAPNPPPQCSFSPLLLEGPTASGKGLVFALLADRVKRAGGRVMWVSEASIRLNFGDAAVTAIARVFSACLCASDAPTLLIWEGLEATLPAASPPSELPGVVEGARALCRAVLGRCPSRLVPPGSAMPLELPTSSGGCIFVASVENASALHPLAHACFGRTVRLGFASPSQAAGVMEAVLRRHGLLGGGVGDTCRAGVRFVGLPTRESLLALATTSCSAFRLGDALTAARQTAALVLALAGALQRHAAMSAAVATAPDRAVTADVAAGSIDVGVALQRLLAGHTPASCGVSSSSSGTAGSAAAHGLGAAEYVELPFFCSCGSEGAASGQLSSGGVGGSGSRGTRMTAAASASVLASAPPGVVDFVDYGGQTPRGNAHASAAAVFAPPGGRSQAAFAAAAALARSGPAAATHHRAVPAALSLRLRPAFAAVQWRDIAGARAAKRALHDMLLWPLAHAGAAAALGLSLPTGILLHGPPGTGKTLLAKALATSLGARFLDVPIPLILRAGVGESERALAAAFEAASASAPCVVFLDECQALFGRRSSLASGRSDAADRMAALLTSQLLQSLDAVAEANGGGAGRGGSGGAGVAPAELTPRRRVFVLAATNVLSAVDPALLRPGRLDRAIFVGPPSRDDRAELFLRLAGRWVADGRLALHLPEPGVATDGALLSTATASGSTSQQDAATLAALAGRLADLTSGSSGADVVNVARHAATLAIRHALAGQPARGSPDKPSAYGSRSLVMYPSHLLDAARELAERQMRPRAV